MTIEEFNKKMQSISDTELVDMCEKEISKLCKTGGRSFTMQVPVNPNDTDMILIELLKRFKALKSL